MTVTYSSDCHVADAIVVGAGLSGLAAAWRLKKAGKSVIVLEARNRVGGKVYDKQLPNGSVIELGAAYIGPTQDRIQSLMDELQIGAYPHYDAGKNVFYDGDRRALYNDGEIPLSETTLSQLGASTEKLEVMANKLNASEPWKHPDAAEYDSMTLETWLQHNLTDETARHLTTATVRSLISAEPSDISLLQFLTYIRRAGNEVTPGTFARLVGIKDSAQESRVQGGPQLIATRLAEQLGGAIKLEAPVTRIDLHCPTYHVSGHAFSYRSNAVIVALAPPLATRITYTPPLPANRDQMCQHMPMGSLGKVYAIYDSPFWRDDGLSGKAIGLQGATVQITFDSSPEDGSFGAIIGFLEADVMRRLDTASEKEIQNLVLTDYVNFFGDKAKEVKHWVIQRWDNEEYSRGGHFAVSPPNTMTRFGSALRQPVGRLFFAGTEASPYWAGFMDGAVRAGELAADAVIDLDTRSDSVVSKL
jgi:monoamine oxidase